MNKDKLMEFLQRYALLIGFVIGYGGGTLLFIFIYNTFIRP